MSDIIHAKEYLEEGDVVVVQCSHQCNVRLMDDANYQSFRRAGRHKYYGGFFRMLPARIVVPHDGHWNVTMTSVVVEQISDTALAT